MGGCSSVDFHNDQIMKGQLGRDRGQCWITYIKRPGPKPLFVNTRQSSESRAQPPTYTTDICHPGSQMDLDSFPGSAQLCENPLFGGEEPNGG